MNLHHLKRVAAIVIVCCASLFEAMPLYAAPLTLQDAVAKVEKETHGKVLSAETKRTGNRTVYRVKVLTHDGRVQIIEVPAEG
jgi:uncharacterized membrane protein YkoI